MTLSTPDLSLPRPADVDLVARSLRGERDAYAKIVERYQSIVCAVTYSACGDVHQSEDLAQETFVAGWKNLRDLKEPSQLRAWLRGIARNLAHNALRKGRTPAARTQLDEVAIQSDSPTPADDAITREEQDLLWQNLAKLPEEYREPLVLYYREQQSAAAVGKALGISEEAARQRLSRGRAMLAARIEKLIDRGLRQSAPGKGFTLGVMSALPGMALSHATATASAAAAAKSGVSAKAAASIGGIAGWMFAPIIGFFGAYMGYRVGMEQTIAPEERRYVGKYSRSIFWNVLLLDALILAVVFAGSYFHISPFVSVFSLLSICLAFVAVLVYRSVCYVRGIRRLRMQLIAERPELREAADRVTARWTLLYRSRRRFLGLPLVDIQVGGSPEMKITVAKGWIAIGGVAYSPFLAIGGFAFAPISWGAISAGVLTYGAVAAGYWTIGVFAIGVKAMGVCAIGWHGAQGIVALAHGYASGITAFAKHANNARANRVMNSELFFRAWGTVCEHGTWLWVVTLIPLLLMIGRAAKIRRGEARAGG